MARKLIFILAFVAVSVVVRAQEPSVQQTIEDLLESVGEGLTDETDIQEILEDLENFRQNPLKINQATSEELMRLHLLSEVQASNLIRFREKTGTIFSLYEMAAIDGFTPDILQKIEPFISFDTQSNGSGKRQSSGSLFLKSTRTFSSENTSTSTKNEGSPERYYMRLKHSLADFEYGVTAEKDPGEAFFSQSNKKGFDYTSAFANFRLGQKGNRIFLGDYHVRFGQGLVAWQGFSMGKSSETTQVFRSNQGIRSYSSTDENQFFRGVAGQFRFKRFSFSPFISLNKLDANIDTLDGKPYFGAFQTSGYHRYGSEITGENALTQLAGGANVTYSYNRWSFGATAVYTRFNAVMERGDEPYNQFLPEGKENMVAGFNWNGSVKNVFFFGEGAVGRNSGRALLSGMMFKPAKNAEFSMVYRNINKNYFSYFGNAFTESSRVNDERALYLGLKIFPASGWIVQAYADFFRFGWIKYLTAAPSDGTELFAQVSYSPSRQTNFYLRLFQEEKGQRLISDGLKYNAQQLINRVRFNFDHDLNERISLKGRLELAFYSKEGSEQGFLIYQDVFYRMPRRPFTFSGRVAYFQTDGYNSRIYSYENDVLYAFSVPANYGRGIRGCFNFQYRFGDKLALWLKFASTRQLKNYQEGQAIETSAKSELKVLLRYQF